MRPKPDAVDRELARSALGANGAALAPQRDRAVNARVFRELVELGHVREADVGPVIRTDDGPILSRGRDREHEDGDKSADRFNLLPHARALARNRDLGRVQAGDPFAIDAPARIIPRDA